MAESDNESGGQIRGGEVSTVCREQDRYLPIANVSRIMKKALPANAKISKEAKETVQECVSEFISFITGEASDKCQKEKRKTINGDDLLWAMTTLGFEDYVEPLKLYLHKYREMEGEKTAILGQAQHRHQAPSASSAHDHADANANAATTLYAHHGGAGGVINMMMMPQHHHHHHQHHHH